MARIRLSHYTKAIAAAASTFGAGYVVATQAASPGGEGITGHEWQGLAVSAVLAGILVWAVPNTPAPPAPPAA